MLLKNLIVKYKRFGIATRIIEILNQVRVQRVNLNDKASAQAVDMAMDSIGRSDLSDCGNGKDTIALRILNFSNAAQSTYSVSYQIDNNPVVKEDVRTVNILPNSSFLSIDSGLLSNSTLKSVKPLSERILLRIGFTKFKN